MPLDIPHRSAAAGPPAVTAGMAGGAHAEGLGSLAEALDRILVKGVAVDGAVTIGVAGVDLIMLDLRLLLAAVDTVRPDGPFFSAPLAGPVPSPPSNRPAPPPAGIAGPATAPAIAGAGGDIGFTPHALLPVTDDSAFDPLRPKGPEKGLIKLALTIVNLLHEVLERQAVRRMGNGTMSEQQTEDIGAALQAQAMEIDRLRQQFGLSEADLTLRLFGPG